jgi:tetratricopeptide (TPR) repeat protein
LLALDERAASNLELGNDEAAIDDYRRLFLLRPDFRWKNPDRLTNLGSAYMGLDRYMEALNEFDKCIELFPEEIPAYLERADYYEHFKEYGKALADYNEVLRIDPQNIKALVKRGRCFQLMQDYTKDLPDLEHVLSIQPKNAAAYKYIGLHAAHIGDLNKAASDLDTSISLNPSDAQAYEEHAKVLVSMGNIKGAIKDYDKLALVTTFVPELSFYIHRSNLRMQASDFDGALDDLNNAMQQDTANSSTYLLKRADCFAGLKRYKDAIADTVKVLGLEPGNIEALLKHARYNWQNGNKITAMEDFFRALKLNPRYPNTYVQRGLCFLEDGQIDAAERDFSDAVEIDPNLTEAKAKLDLCNARLKLLTGKKTVRNVQEVAEATTKPLSKVALNDIGKMNFDQLLHKGYEMLSKGDKSYAIATLTRAVTLKPNDPNARKYLLYALIASGNATLATEQFYVLEKLGAQTLPDELKMASALAATNNTAGSKIYAALLQKYTTDPEAVLKIATACSSDGYQEQAVQACDKALSTAADINLVHRINALRVSANQKYETKPTFEPSKFKSGIGEAPASVHESP